jgi:hypothetical protein
MNNDTNDPPRRRIRNRRNQRDASVGYRRPPRQHQFRPGESGNPRGRPRGAKNESTILREILSRKIKTRSGERVRTISVLEGIVLRIADDSLKGNIKSAAFLLDRFGAMVSGELQRPDLSDDDREILETYARRLDAERANRRES